jgi:poly-gamma-glutamate capsule biosynthesis protein CapA/YwtB (metallophosphatase superfamily)
MRHDAPPSAASRCVPTPDATDFRIATVLAVVDESGRPIVGAQVLREQAPGARGEERLGEAAAPAETRRTGDDGRVDVRLEHGPEVVMVTAPGYLDEIVPLGFESEGRTVEVRLLSTRGGARVVVHSVGDVMLGRRYEQPREGDPLVPEGAEAEGARRVVEHVRRAFLASDFRTLNLETAVSARDASAAYPGKRFILRTRPDALAGIAALEPSVVVLANNHVRDYLDDGVRDTLDALQARALPSVGAVALGSDDDARPRPFTFDVRGTRIGVLAWTTVDGSFVNDSYPRDGKVKPDDLATKDAWQYEPRAWGFQGASWAVESAMRRIGSAWDIFASAEKGLSPSETRASFRSLTTVYPEVQDWVARRGHGGAARWDAQSSPSQIGELAAESDIVIVQLHAGFQFQEAASENVARMARAAIDAGASLVVCHHPHVLQGFEWYKGKLIAYSLGNFLFDQDFLSTFSSAILRTVWERGALVEARLVPVEIAGYKPTIATGQTARRTLARVWERSLLEARSDRDGMAVRAYTRVRDADTAPAHLRFEWGTGRLLRDKPAESVATVRVEAGASVALQARGLVDARAGEAEGSPIEIGRDLFGFGSFEDELADGKPEVGTHWQAGVCTERATTGEAASGVGFLRVQRTALSTSRASIRPIARVPLTRHRVWSRGPTGTPSSAGQSASPLDPPASYSLRMKARREGGGEAMVRIDFYTFDDQNPTEDPSSAIVGSSEYPIDVPIDGLWHDLDIPIPQATLGEKSVANMVLFYVRLSPREGGAPGAAIVDLDDLAFVEWRPAAAMPPGFGDYGFLRNAGAGAREVTFRFLPAELR